MDCKWTEKISTLLDGELNGDEARAAERHLEACRPCRLAREDFLLLRQQLTSYHAERDAVAERRALRTILEGGRGADTRDTAAGLALVLVGAVAGLLLLRRPRTPEVARVTPVLNSSPTVAGGGSKTNEDAKPVGVEKTVEGAAVKDRNGSGTNIGGAGVLAASTRGGGGVRRAAVRGSGVAKPAIAVNGKSRMVQRLRLPVTPRIDLAPEEALAGELASGATADESPELRTARHVEQAQMLLRSVRNARLAEGDAPADSLAGERRRSRDLLYRNIVLRREAERRGDVAVASVLDSLETVLIDIANLPDSPRREDVLSITERMRRKQIVAMLQIAGDARIY
jgi:hypothetical protein